MDAKKDQIAAAYSLGLKKIGDVSIWPDDAATMGMIQKIIHFVVYEEE